MEHPRNVLITGAHGLIGNVLYQQLAAQPQRYAVYGMARDNLPSRPDLEHFVAVPQDKLRIAYLADFTAVQRAADGMDTVVHLAAEPSGNGSWQSVLENNIIGAQHLFEACRVAGVKRVIFASTNQVVFGYGQDEPYRLLLEQRYEAIDMAAFQPIRETQPTRPLNYYACSKIFGESLAHMYAFSHGLSCLCLRIGWVTPDDQPPDGMGASLWCSQRDIVQMVERCIQAPESLRFDVFFVQSDNRYNLIDTRHASEVLGYTPQDSVEARRQG